MGLRVWGLGFRGYSGLWGIPDYTVLCHAVLCYATFFPPIPVAETSLIYTLAEAKRFWVQGYFRLHFQWLMGLGLKKKDEG